MIKNFVSVLFATGLVLALLPLTAVPMDSMGAAPSVVTYYRGPWETEPNDSAEQANGPIRSHWPYYGYHNDADDYYHIDLRAEGKITIDLSNHSGQGVELQLFYETTDTPVAERQASPYQIDYTGPVGDYYVRVYTASDFDSTTPYTLQATFPMAHSIHLPITPRSLMVGRIYEPNHSFDEAWGPLESGTAYHGYFPSTVDNDDYYYFELAATHNADIWLTDIPSGNNYDLYLYDAGETAIAQSRNGGNSDEHIARANLAAGKYYVHLTREGGTSSWEAYSLEVDLNAPLLTATKSAAPTDVLGGEEVVYTVRINNPSAFPGTLGTIEDTLPVGFTFLSMTPGSDVSTPPSGTSGTVVWNGPFVVPAGGDLSLVYRVRTGNVGGTFANSVTATALVGTAPATPARASVTVEPSLSFSDDFEDGIDAWTPYTNYWRLDEGQWFWDLGQGVWGSNGYTNFGNAGVDPNEPEDGAHDSLTMYLGEGSEEWTNYRYRAKFNLLGGRQAGLWFRGTYKDVETPGQWFTGYYFTIKVRAGETDTVKLWQFRTDDDHDDETWPPYWYHFSNPMEIEMVHLSQANVEPGRWHELRVEVQGPHIKCYVDDELAIDYIDTEGDVFLKGTVGLYTYGAWPNVAVVQFDDVLVEPLP